MVSRGSVTRIGGVDGRRARAQGREEVRAKQACAILKRPASGLPAGNGMGCASREDGSDPCSVRGTQSHVMLDMRALCRLEGMIITLEQNTHQKISFHKLRVSQHETRMLDYEPEGRFLTTNDDVWRCSCFLPICYILKNRKHGGSKSGVVYDAEELLEPQQ